ncbi:S-phase kinase-associated protein 1-like [Coccinella septempunctata]|uniref:S-phase kinase-associated protein 1-like n=1 Tax=Coccinella septempunctata TaxID=41139 RepID=UPI001D071709|nr:S-phase kinase-associated protein 1-like [Coccinella septempunctata]
MDCDKENMEQQPSTSTFNNAEIGEGSKRLRNEEVVVDSEESSSKKAKNSICLLKVRTSNGKLRFLDLNIMRCSSVIRHMVDNLGVDDLGEMEIPIQVNSTVLNTIETWATHHKDDYMILETDDNPDNLPSWDSQFFNVDKEILCDILLAADYLEIKSLMKVVCKKIVSRIRGKRPCEMHFYLIRC